MMPIRLDSPWFPHPGSSKVVQTSAVVALGDRAQSVVRMQKNPTMCKTRIEPSTRWSFWPRKMLKMTAKTKTAMVRSVPCQRW